MKRNDNFFRTKYLIIKLQTTSKHTHKMQTKRYFQRQFKMSHRTFNKAENLQDILKSSSIVLFSNLSILIIKKLSIFFFIFTHTLLQKSILF